MSGEGSKISERQRRSTRSQKEIVQRTSVLKVKEEIPDGNTVDNSLKKTIEKEETKEVYTVRIKKEKEHENNEKNEALLAKEEDCIFKEEHDIDAYSSYEEDEEEEETGEESSEEEGEDEEEEEEEDEASYIEEEEEEEEQASPSNQSNSHGDELTKQDLKNAKGTEDLNEERKVLAAHQIKRESDTTEVESDSTYQEDFPTEGLLKELHFLNASCERSSRSRSSGSQTHKTPKKPKRLEGLDCGSPSRQGSPRKRIFDDTSSSSKSPVKGDENLGKKSRGSPPKNSSKSPVTGKAKKSSQSPESAESSEDEDRMLTIVAEEEVTPKKRKLSSSPGKAKKRQRMDSEDVPLEVIELIQTGIDDVLEEKAERTHLTAVHVKNIIKNVMTDENVLAMVRNTVFGNHDPESESAAVYEPTLTRAKAKELMQKHAAGIWSNNIWAGLSNTGKGSTTNPTSETQALATTEFPEEDEDEEYTPETDEQALHSDDESHVSTGFGSDIGSPTTPCTPLTPMSTTTPSSHVSQPTPRSTNILTPVNHHLETIKNSNVLPRAVQRTLNFDKQPEKEELVSQRTRSKLPLTETPLECLEMAFKPPDVTRDMYETELDDEDWKSFLIDFIHPLKSGETVEDEEADPEYNILEDNAEDDLDLKEEMRGDRAVQISKKEINELMTELIAQWSVGSDDEGPDALHPFAKPCESKEKKTTTEPPRICSPDQNKEAGPPPGAIWVEAITAKFESDQYDILHSQLIQHVQLLATSVLMCSENDALEDMTNGCIALLENMKEHADSSESITTFYRPFNLQAALEISYAAKEIPYSEPPPPREPQVRRQVIEIPKGVIEKVLESCAFPYPHLLPVRMFYRPDVGQFSNKANFVPAENVLIAMGLERYFPEELKKHMCRRKQYPAMIKALALTTQNLLRSTKTVHQLYTRIKNLRTRKRDEEGLRSNPICQILETGKYVAPAATIEPLHMCVPCPIKNFPVEYLKDPWQRIVFKKNKAMKKMARKAEQEAKSALENATFEASQRGISSVQSFIIIQPPGVNINTPVILPGILPTNPMTQIQPAVNVIPGPVTNILTLPVVTNIGSTVLQIPPMTTTTQPGSESVLSNIVTQTTSTSTVQSGAGNPIMSLSSVSEASIKKEVLSTEKEKTPISQDSSATRGQCRGKADDMDEAAPSSPREILGLDTGLGNEFEEECETVLGLQQELLCEESDLDDGVDFDKKNEKLQEVCREIGISEESVRPPQNAISEDEAQNDDAENVLTDAMETNISSAETEQKCFKKLVHESLKKVSGSTSQADSLLHTAAVTVTTAGSVVNKDNDVIATLGNDSCCNAPGDLRLAPATTNTVSVATTVTTDNTKSDLTSSSITVSLATPVKTAVSSSSNVLVPYLQLSSLLQTPQKSCEQESKENPHSKSPLQTPVIPLPSIDNSSATPEKEMVEAETATLSYVRDTSASTSVKDNACKGNVYTADLGVTVSSSSQPTTLIAVTEQESNNDVCHGAQNVINLQQNKDKKGSGVHSSNMNTIIQDELGINNPEVEPHQPSSVSESSSQNKTNSDAVNPQSSSITLVTSVYQSPILSSGEPSSLGMLSITPQKPKTRLRKISPAKVLRSPIKTSPMKQVSPILRKYHKYSPKKRKRSDKTTLSPILPKITTRSSPLQRTLAPKPVSSRSPSTIMTRGKSKRGTTEIESFLHGSVKANDGNLVQMDDEMMVPNGETPNDIPVEGTRPRTEDVHQSEEEFEEDFLEEEEEDEEEDLEAAQQQEEHLAALLKASSTIAWRRGGGDSKMNSGVLAPGERRLNKQQRRLQARINALSTTPDSVTQDKVIVQNYLMRVQEALVGKDPEQFKKFLFILGEFTENQKSSPLHLYNQLCEILKDFPHLADEFVSFLLPQQAIEIGKYPQYCAIHRMRDFLDKLQLQFPKQPQYIQKILKTVASLQARPNLTVDDLKAALTPLLRYPHLVECLTQMFPSQPPPPSLPGDFEEIDLDNPGPPDGMETIVLPDDEPHTSPDHCTCPCHLPNAKLPNTHPFILHTSNLSRSDHCQSCAIRFCDGRVYLQYGKTLRPAKVTYHSLDTRAEKSLSDLETSVENVKRPASSTSDSTSKTKNDAPSMGGGDRHSHTSTNETVGKGKNVTNRKASHVKDGKESVTSVPGKEKNVQGPPVSKSQSVRTESEVTTRDRHGAKGTKSSREDVIPSERKGSMQPSRLCDEGVVDNVVGKVESQTVKKESRDDRTVQHKRSTKVKSQDRNRGQASRDVGIEDSSKNTNSLQTDLTKKAEMTKSQTNKNQFLLTGCSPPKDIHDENAFISSYSKAKITQKCETVSVLLANPNSHSHVVDERRKPNTEAVIITDTGILEKEHQGRLCNMSVTESVQSSTKKSESMNSKCSSIGLSGRNSCSIQNANTCSASVVPDNSSKSTFSSKADSEDTNSSSHSILSTTTSLMSLTPNINRDRDVVFNDLELSSSVSVNSAAGSGSTSVTSATVTPSAEYVITNPFTDLMRSIPWTKDEDLQILTVVQEKGTDNVNFGEIAEALPGRTQVQVVERFNELVTLMMEESDVDSMSVCSEDNAI